MPKRLYAATERFVSDSVKDLLTEKLLAADEEEQRLATERGDFHQGVQAITAVADRGWSKRCHKHSYNAKSGVAVIFGQCTKKLLFVGVHNKYCAVCSMAEKQEKEAPQHRCYCNWSRSYAVMESDIVRKGFRLSEQTYGIRYM